MSWVAVKDRLPDEDGPYLIHAESGDPKRPLICTAWYDPRGFGWSLIRKEWIPSITHWMPLPPAPSKARKVRK